MYYTIDFYNSIYIPRIWCFSCETAIEQTLPTTKTIFNKLNEYLIVHPEFYSILRTNLWRIHRNPSIVLEEKLPIDLWYFIDGFIHEDPYQLLIQKCKEYYISILQSQLDDELYIQASKIEKDILCKSIYCLYYDKHRMDQCKSMQRFLKNYKDKYLHL
tara:strand:- start:273 stop:749 length:477 start_codon:yes stop_codon:yes gene_type:complete